MSEEVLNERAKAFLKSLIQEFIQTGEPVGSRRLSRLSEEGLSPATIRNIMADLEESGFVAQPHTSAGRIPTEKGYRFYVNTLLDRTELSKRDISEIELTLENGDPTAENLMTRASHILSTVSNNVGFVLAPPVSKIVLRHVEFLRLSDKRVLIILVGESGTVQNRVISTDNDMSQQELDFAGKYLVTNLAGMTLPQIRNRLVQLMSEEKALYDKMLQKVIKLGTAGLEETKDEGSVYVEGTARLMRNPEFADVRQMIEIFEMFEQKSRLVKIISECIRTDEIGHKVAIGLESLAPGAQHIAVIASAYNYGNQMQGTLGVLGPARMEYARAIPLVEYVAKVVEKILNRN
ncbi:MAG TPA: heat-inducible transcriptional repressor HrcA [Acidobacteriota bacterium]|jgi:heat-inducible transcriptional repressor|nr:heat-inducible transcriptional repressor HrcA [Acidobacteriota bacterium]